MKKWQIERQKQGMEIWVTNFQTDDAIFIGECYQEKKRKRTHYLAAIIVDALNKAEVTDEENEKKFEESLKEADWGHQPC